MNFQNTNLSLPDILIVVAYLVICLVIGLQKAGKIKTIRDYTLGFKPFSTGVLIATTFATAISSYNTVGYVAKTYELGLVFILSGFFVPICWFILAKLFEPNLEDFQKKRFMSFSDIMEHWYGNTGRWLTNIGAIIKTLGVTAASATAIGYLLHYFLNIPEIWGMCIGIFVVAVYSASGGIQAVAYTDVFQFLIFFIAIPIACAIGISKAGGVEKVFHSLPPTHTTINKSNILLFLSLVLYALIPDTGIPYVQRALLAKDRVQFRKTFIISGMLMWPLFVLIAFIAFIAYNSAPGINSNLVFYHFVDHNVQVILKGFMIAGLLAIIMSTQDSFLNTTSSLISHDVCKKIWPSLTDKQELLIARISCVLIAILSIAIIFVKKSIMDILWLVDNFWFPLVAMPFLAGLMGARVSRKYFLILIISVFVTETWSRYITGSFDNVSLVVGIITSVVVLLIGHLHHRKKTTGRVFPQVSAELLFVNFVERAKKNNFSTNSIYTISIFVGLNYVLGFFALSFSKYNILYYLFVFTTSISVLLILNELWVSGLRKYVATMWKISLVVSLLVIPSVLMFTNIFNLLWILNFALSALLFFFLTNAIVGSVSILLAMALGFMLRTYFPFITSNAIIESWFAVIPCVLVTITIMNKIYQNKYIDKEVKLMLEQKVKERTAELKEALEARKEFLSKVGHEIRIPMQGTLGIADVLADKWDNFSNEDRRKYVQIIADSSTRLMSYTSNILDLAQIHQDKFTLDVSKDVDLVKIVKDAIHDTESLIMAQNKDLKIKLDTSAKEQILVECDSTRVTQVVSNVLSNAVKYSEKGLIRILLKPQKLAVLLAISDNGVGVPDGEKERIFEPFFEGSRTKSPACGTGLGLAIAKEIIGLHLGNITVTDNKPNGSTFNITIPYKYDGQKAAVNDIVFEAAQKLEQEAKERKAVIVTEDPISFNSLNLLINRLGYEYVDITTIDQDYTLKSLVNIDLAILDRTALNNLFAKLQANNLQLKN